MSDSGPAHPPGPLHYVGLRVDGMYHDAQEASEAGLSLAAEAAECAGLAELRRGDERKATLWLSGNGWGASYDVVLRFAGRGPSHLEFAFAHLPAAARHELKRDLSWRPAEPEPEAWEQPGPAPFAFSQLLEGEAPDRRLVLSASEAVLSLTRRREQQNGLCPEPPAVPPNAALQLGAFHVGTVRDPRPSVPGSVLFVVGTLLSALLVYWLAVFG